VLSLRPFVLTDVNVARTWLDDDDSSRFLAGVAGNVRASMDRQIGHLDGSLPPIAARLHRWIALHDGEPCGVMWCDEYLHVSPLSAKIAYVINPAFRGQRLCTPMLLAVMEDLALVRVWIAYADPANTASVACLRRAGFTQFGSDQGQTVYRLQR